MDVKRRRKKCVPVKLLHPVGFVLLTLSYFVHLSWTGGAGDRWVEEAYQRGGGGGAAKSDVRGVAASDGDASAANDRRFDDELDRNATLAARSALVSGDSSSSSSDALSLAVLVHCDTVLPAKTFLLNMVRGLTTGLDRSAFQSVVVFYDSRKDGPRMDTFMKDMNQLKADGVVTKLVEVRWSTAIQEAVGVRDPNFEDGMMYTTYQFLVEECTTRYCACLTYDIMAHEGGGLQHAVNLLRQRPELVFAVPPLGVDYANYSRSDELRPQFKDARGRYPFDLTLGELRPPQIRKGAEVACRAGKTRLGFSTRYYVADPIRFRETIPFSPVFAGVLEEHPALLTRKTVCQGSLTSKVCKLSRIVAWTRCDQVEGGGTGFLLHPPPYQMGDRLHRKCGIKALQRVMDKPESLVVCATYNNMIEESWAAACEKYRSDDKTA